MSNKAITWARDIPVCGNRKLVLFVLADHANEEGECWPGINRLMQICGISRRSVISHIKELTDFGLMFKKTRCDNQGHRTSNLYRLNLECQPSLSANTAPSLSANTAPRIKSLCANITGLSANSGTLLYIEPKEEPKDICKVVSFPAKNIFEHWQKTLDHPRAKLDGKRKAIINKAIKLGYSEGDLKTAIEGCAKTPFNMGENDNNTKYDDIELILRDAKHIEQFMDNCKNPPKPTGAKAASDPWAAGGMYAGE